jgi:ribosomal protein L37E
MGTVNKQGFPVEMCTRCGGCGRHSFNDVHGDTCMKCGGAGFTIVRKALPAWNAYRTALRNSKQCTASELVVGDFVAVEGKWRQVEAIGITPLVRGWTTVFEHTSPTGTKVPSQFGMWLTIAGETKQTTTSTIYNRKSKPVDPAQFLAMIPKTRVKK